MNKKYVLWVHVNGQWLDVFEGDYVDVLLESQEFSRFKIKSHDLP